MIFDRATRTRILRCGVIVGAAAALGACAPTTYGTGVGTTAQTLQDVANIVSLRSPDAISYQARPGLVMPPNNELPPPVTCNAAPAQVFIGQTATNRQVNEIRGAAQANSSVVIHPGDAALTDSRLDRVVIQVNAANVILSITCA